jgi:phosphoglycerate kinase
MTTRPAALAGLPLLEDLGNVSGKRVLVRSDLNVPLTQRDGTSEVADDFRIRQAVPTLKWLQEHGATVVCCTHVGRPHGQEIPELSIGPIASSLAQYIDGIDVLENLRFDPGEENNDPAFVAELVDEFDCYVNDAFGASHRAHASVVGPPRTLPSAAGRLLEREVEMLGGLLVDPKRPFVAIVGGAKVADKLGMVRSLCEKADAVVIGGGMAFTFLAAQGRDVGDSMLDESRISECLELLEGSTPILLPTDVVALGPGGTFGDGERSGEVHSFDGDIPSGWMGLDIGPQSGERYASEILSAETVLWNGPMGVFEDPRFAEGTRIVGRAVAEGRGTSVVGGGDSAMAAEQFGFAGKIDFMSTGGGASLEFIEYGDLPALEALRHAPNAPGGS